MINTILGATGIQQPTILQRNATGGVKSSIDRWEGTADFINSIIATLAVGVAYRVDDTSAPLYRLTVESPTDALVTFELRGNPAQKDLIEHPKLSKYPATVLMAIKRFANGIPSDYAEGVSTIKSECVNAGLSDSNALEYFDYYAKGQTYFQCSNYALVTSQILSSNTQVQIGFDNIETIYTPAQLLKEVSVRGTPVGLGIDKIKKEQVDPGPKYTYGWLKQTPSLVPVALGMYSYQVEFWLDYWLTSVYGLSTSAT